MVMNQLLSTTADAVCGIVDKHRTLTLPGFAAENVINFLATFTIG
jgi:hypothetical protein